MKRLSMLATLVVLALPTVAEEKPKAEKAPESALVAAAKRTKRAGSATIVITDDMVKKATGHVTSTTVNYTPTVPPPAPPTAEMKDLDRKAKVKAAQAKKDADAKAAAEEKKKALERQARLAEAAEEYEDGYDDGVDPAQLEQELAATAKAEEKKP
jgi:hypothetical protein